MSASQKYPNPQPEQIVAISCTVVGIGDGGGTSMLARIALVDYRGQTLLCTYVQPTMPVSDYRTATTGIEPEHLSPNNAMKFSEVQSRIASLIKGKVLIGHSLWNDLSVIGIPHPAVATRDVALYQPFRNSLRSPNKIVGLPTLMWQLMRRRCSDDKICALEIARATLDLYRSVATEWEAVIAKGQWPCHLPPNTFARCYL
ncbi:ribonuclease H-like domain-containing protein [Abortiporus biennis]|nr:ribonuclease H-like domain-containing protein [Abortiporus biennis]